MRGCGWMLGLLALPTAAMAAEPVGVKFWGFVEKDDTHIVSYYLTVPPGETAKLEMGSGFRLEFVAAGEDGARGQSEVRLFDARGRRVHEKIAEGHAPMNVSGAYTICRGNVTYISPAPSEPAGCED